MNQRLRYSSLALAATAALALAACSPAAVAPSDDAELSGSLTFAIWNPNFVPYAEAAIELFNETHPDVEIAVDQTPWAQYWTKIQNGAAGGTLPDVFLMNGPNATLYASNGILEPITELVDAGTVDPANYPDALNEIYTYEGVQYGVPKDFDTIALWYNKAILEAAGVEAPTADWTWDDFNEAALTVSETLKDEGIYGVSTAIGADGGQQSYWNTIFQAGGEVITDGGTKSGYDDPATWKGLQFWADLVANGASPSIQQLSDTPADAWFMSGKSAFYMTGSWMVTPLSEADNAADLQVAPLPRGERQATVIHGLATVVSATSENKAAAQAFQAFMGSEEAQLLQAEFAAAIPAFNGTQAAFVAAHPEFDLQVYLDATEYAVMFPSSKNTAAWNALETELLPQAFSGERTVEDVAKELAAKMNELLAKE